MGRYMQGGEGGRGREPSGKRLPCYNNFRLAEIITARTPNERCTVIGLSACDGWRGWFRGWSHPLLSSPPWAWGGDRSIPFTGYKRGDRMHRGLCRQRAVRRIPRSGCLPTSEADCASADCSREKRMSPVNTTWPRTNHAKQMFRKGSLEVVKSWREEADCHFLAPSTRD